MIERVVDSRRTIKTVMYEQYEQVLKNVIDPNTSVIDRDDQKTLEVLTLIKEFDYDSHFYDSYDKQKELLERLVMDGKRRI